MARERLDSPLAALKMEEGAISQGKQQTAFIFWAQRKAGTWFLQPQGTEWGQQLISRKEVLPSNLQGKT